ncbi:MAG: hypothetical protein WCO55_06315 [Candidatus Falkowbacteria bacterium]
MPEEKDLNSLAALFAQRVKQPQIKPPAHQWQDMALRIISELGVPANKRGSVFQACKQHSPEVIQLALTDTKELVQKGEPWKYFFKVLANRKKPL